MGHLRLTSIGYLKATVANIRVTLGHLRVTLGHLWVTLGNFFPKAIIRQSKENLSILLSFHLLGRCPSGLHINLVLNGICRCSMSDCRIS